MLKFDSDISVLWAGSSMGILVWQLSTFPFGKFSNDLLNIFTLPFYLSLFFFWNPDVGYSGPVLLIFLPRDISFFVSLLCFLEDFINYKFKFSHVSNFPRAHFVFLSDPFFFFFVVSCSFFNRCIIFFFCNLPGHINDFFSLLKFYFFCIICLFSHCFYLSTYFGLYFSCWRLFPRNPLLPIHI